MDYSSVEESDISDSEILGFKEKPLEELRSGKFSIEASLANGIDKKNDNFDDLQIKYKEKTISLSRILEEKDRLHLKICEETREMQRVSREHIQRVLAEQKMLNLDLEKRKKQLDSWSRELNKREAYTKHGR